MTATCETTVDGLGQHEAETCRLCQLPDVPLMLIFSYLPMRDELSCMCIDDHFAVACACPRVAALTRTLPSIWLERKVNLEFDDEGVTETRTLDLLRAGPPVDKLVFTRDLVYNMEEDDLAYDRLGTFSSYRIQSQTESIDGGVDQHSPTSLMLTVNFPENPASLIREVGPALKHLDALEGLVPLGSLAHAQNLETLNVNVGGDLANKLPWPQSMSLPRLHTVRLDCKVTCDDATFDALRSLLLAHSGQLRSVALLSTRGPLEYCWSSARVRRELDFGEHSDEFASLLRSWSGPLERLVLEGIHYDETVRALGEGGLTSLTRLELDMDSHSRLELESLGLALAGLPRLCRLELSGKAPPTEVIRGVPLAAIAALELILIRGVDRDELDQFDDPAADLLVPELKKLVLRAPKQLHVVLSTTRGVELFFRHSAADAGCPLCAEAVAALPSYWRQRVEKQQVPE